MKEKRFIECIVWGAQHLVMLNLPAPCFSSGVQHLRFIASILCVVLTSISYVSAQSERSLVRDGNRAYDEQKFTDAEVNYRKALEKNKDFHEGLFNLGGALYRQERFDEAAESYRISISKSKDALTRAQALHNLGNAFLKAQKVEESISAYKEALKLNPSDFDTKYNLEYAKMLLKHQPKKDKQKQEQNNNQQKKEQQNQSHQQQNQPQQEQSQQQQKHGQQQKQQISKEDAVRILEALKNEEKNVQKKLQKKVPTRVRVEKDW